MPGNAGGTGKKRKFRVFPRTFKALATCPRTNRGRRFDSKIYFVSADFRPYTPFH
ncbi:hypothetical protein BPC006_II1247 [Burkholderia pseudomallei BPC006]|uniref:Outer membrane porin OpcP n=1 Tax=Burkholderia pseudomallei 1710a TaxID=320371 RepID=A0A0E1W0V1_BURPE|nr:hypothetical protein BPC006_II1247 [Burkholderia pseudomallei BPC006]EET03282.1 outer membrane porin OpcP [Burkholderia pseudomallei 1710a]